VKKHVTIIPVTVFDEKRMKNVIKNLKFIFILFLTFYQLFRSTIFIKLKRLSDFCLFFATNIFLSFDNGRRY
jgi:hypothetical protein